MVDSIVVPSSFMMLLLLSVETNNSTNNCYSLLTLEFLKTLEVVHELFNSA